MKKIVSLFLALLLVFSASITVFAIENNDEDYSEIEEFVFSATVITSRYVETTDKYAFCAIGDVYGSGRLEPFTFGVSRENILGDEDIIGKLEIGRIISVVYNGEIMESYPMQINPNYIVVEEEAKELTAAEQYNYLSMFYTEEWLIENGYTPIDECDEDTEQPTEGDAVPEEDAGEEDDKVTSESTPPQEPDSESQISSDEAPAADPNLSILPDIAVTPDGHLSKGEGADGDETGDGETSGAFSPDGQIASDSEAKTDSADSGEVSVEPRVSPWVFVICIAVITVAVILTVYVFIAIKSNLKK